MQCFRIARLSAALLVLSCSALGQGFQNLDFESSTITQTQPAGMVSETNALPGWIAGAFPLNHLPTVGFNNAVSNGVYYSGVFLLGTNSGSAIEGGFSVLLQVAAGPGITQAASIDQTALVPVGSQSILFKAQPGSGSFVVSLGSQTIPLFAQSTGSNYTLYGGDISAFAGQTLDLGFIALKSSQLNSWILDSIQFSSSPLTIVVTPTVINPPYLDGSGQLVLAGTNVTRTAGGNYAVLTSTNVAAPLATWSTNAAGTFGNGGSFSNAITVNTSQAARFFIIKTP